MSSDDKLYTKSHEWVRKEEQGLRIGITDHAVEELQDLVFLELKPESTEVDQGDPIGEVESVKAVADIYSPVSGTIVEANADIEGNLDTLYQDPFGDGWLVVVDPDDESQLEDLMNREEYENHIASE